MFHASFSAVARDSAKISSPHAPASPHTASRPSWWRALWSRRDCRVEEIRHLMLEQSAAVVEEHRRSALQTLIVDAATPQALWSLRQDLMQALVELHGEMLARRRLTDITFMFAGLLDCPRHAVTDAPDASDWRAPATAQLRTDH